MGELEHTIIAASNTRGDPKTLSLFIKYCVFILTCLTFSHLQTALHLMQYTYRDVFFHCLKQFLNLLIWMPFSTSSVFLFHLFHIDKTFTFKDSFLPGKQKKSTLGRDWVNREDGAWGSCRFGSKTAEHSAQCGQVLL